MATKTIHDVLHDIQVALKVPKDQWNDFGKYPYRNAESILQAVKPLLPSGYTVVCDASLTVVGTEMVCQVVASLVGAEGHVSATGYAREPEAKKGMDASQVSGSSTSYAKKYALGNLFAIDGNKDSDAETPSNGGNSKPAPKSRKKAQKPAEGDTAPVEVIDVDKAQLDEAKRVLFRAMQGYAERHGRNVAEIIDATFSQKPADEWTVAEFEAKAYEFTEA